MVQYGKAADGRILTAHFVGRGVEAVEAQQHNKSRDRSQTEESKQ